MFWYKWVFRCTRNDNWNKSPTVLSHTGLHLRGHRLGLASVHHSTPQKHWEPWARKSYCPVHEITWKGSSLSKFTAVISLHTCIASCCTGRAGNLDDCGEKNEMLGWNFKCDEQMWIPFSFALIYTRSNQCDLSPWTGLRINFLAPKTAQTLLWISSSQR